MTANPEVVQLDSLETELPPTSISSGYSLGQPYKFDFELINDGTTALAEITDYNVFREDDGELTHETLLVNEEAVETEKILIGEVSSDLAWSMLSNRCFMFGASADLVSSVWDVVGAPSASHNMIYAIMASLAPFVYLINSVIDVNWAEHSSLMSSDAAEQQQQQHSQHQEPQQIDSPIMHLSTSVQLLQYNTSSSETLREVLSKKEMTPERHFINARRRIKTFSPKRQLVKVMKRSAHRHEYFSAATFGVAALLSVLDLLLLDFSGSYERTILPGSDRAFFDAWSVHTYLLSAIFAVTRSRHRPWKFFSWSECPDSLEDIGDVLFFAGSFIDVLLCDFHFDDDIPFWPVFSALLWFLDACFYVRSDLVTKAAYNTMSLSEQWVLPSITRQIVETTLSDEKQLHENEQVPAHRSYL
eukprot:CAMPEP_0172419802 /NCGR_PEP_ID=MMETSP1064-20121228/6207_1 /TAXON_ID=202472 /ORGANISM="Aulacoseira subarctica , Strain CCAP 1002/5" /LENGTH=415 /DNA_ID=CAMNT_0013159457 /DNA_START=551 /DNA_END=1798 /DNA_ORIENTATION=+